MTTDRPPTVDFGFDPRMSAYHFAHVVDRNGETVHVEERFATESDESDVDADEVRRPIIKAKLDAYRWSRISEPARAEFNRRMAQDGGRAARWRPAESLLAPHYGKELTLLFWVVEDADPTLIPNMVANWTGLAPEERWWLYTTVNATAGHPDHGRDRGWRKAVKIALAENPSAGATPGGWLSRGDIDRPELLTKLRSHTSRTSSKVPDPAQLSLLPSDNATQLSLDAGEASQAGDRP